MVPEASLDVSRRQFLAVAGLTVPPRVFQDILSHRRAALFKVLSRKPPKQR